MTIEMKQFNFTHEGHGDSAASTLEVMKQNLQYMLSNPINCQFWHHSCVWYEKLPQKMVSHP